MRENPTGVKDGEKAGWNYVSFRDDNISVDHKWTDGEMRFSIGIAPKYRDKLSFGQIDERKAKSRVAAWRKSRTEFVNRRNLRVAELKSDWSKVFSSKAKGQSDSYEAHYAAANNLKTLFENGVKYHEERPRNGSADIAAYAKYACPFDVNGETYLAKITVKEYPARGGAKSQSPFRP